MGHESRLGAVVAIISATFAVVYATAIVAAGVYSVPGRHAIRVDVDSDLDALVMRLATTDEARAAKAKRDHCNPTPIEIVVPDGATMESLSPLLEKLIGRASCTNIRLGAVMLPVLSEA